MATTSHGVGGLTFDAKKRSWPPEANVFVALVLITLVFEVLNRIDGGSFLFNTRANVSGLFNQARLDIIVLQVPITGIIALGVTQVIILRRHRFELGLRRRRDRDDRHELRPDRYRERQPEPNARCSAIGRWTCR